VWSKTVSNRAISTVLAMKTVLILAGAAAVLLSVWVLAPEQGQEDASRPSVAAGGDLGLLPGAVSDEVEEETRAASIRRSSAAAGRPVSAAEAGEILVSTRELMTQSLAYMEQNRPDRARRIVQQLKARRDSLPEFLQGQVDRLDAMLETDGAMGPQRVLKAAIIQSAE